MKMVSQVFSFHRRDSFPFPEAKYSEMAASQEALTREEFFLGSPPFESWSPTKIQKLYLSEKNRKKGEPRGGVTT